MQILRMAWRNVWRNSRRSGITIAAMTLALAVELIYSGLIGGMFSDMLADVTDLELGDLQVFSENYLEKPSLYEAVTGQEQLLSDLDAAGYPASVRLFGGGLAAHGDASSGASFIGLDPGRDAAVSTIGDSIDKGEWLSLDDPKGVVLGRGLARTLGVGLDDEVLVLSQGADGSMANDLYRVRGILKSVAAGTDRATIFMTEPTFRELLVFPEGAHKVVIRTPEGVELDEGRAFVASHLPEGSQVKTWKELSPLLAQMLDGVQAQIAIVYFIVYVAVAILILNAMLMALFERIREFGVLKAIGYSPLQVFVMMLVEGFVQACVALVLGVIVASPFMYYLQTHGIDVGLLGGMNMAGMTMPAIWRGVYTVEAAALPVIMLFVIVLGAVLFPAVRAARISPIEAMVHQ